MPSLTSPTPSKPSHPARPIPALALPDLPPPERALRLASPAAEPSEPTSHQHRTSKRGRPTPDPLDYHPHTLTDTELLGLLLARGHEDSTSLARTLLDVCGGLTALPNISQGTLRHCGLRDTQIPALLAACELACRLVYRRIPDREPLTRPDHIARFLTLHYQQRDQELMGAVFLNARHRLLSHQEIFRGTLHRTAVEPREILKQCLYRGAAGFVLFHTHPSGDPTPDAEDILFTRRMAQAATVLGIELVDHLVLGAPGRWASLKELGGW
jgi:DNA repair protein RadC